MIFFRLYFRFADAKTRRLLFFHISKAKEVWEARTALEAQQLEKAIATAVAVEQKRSRDADAAAEALARSERAEAERRSRGDSFSSGSDARVGGGSGIRVGGGSGVRVGGGSGIRVGGGSGIRVGGDSSARSSFSGSESSGGLIGMLSKGVSTKFISEKASAALAVAGPTGAALKDLGSKIGDRLMSTKATPSPSARGSTAVVSAQANEAVDTDNNRDRDNDMATVGSIHAVKEVGGEDSSASQLTHSAGNSAVNSVVNPSVAALLRAPSNLDDSTPSIGEF